LETDAGFEEIVLFIASDVWNDDDVEKLTIQRTVSNLRRRLSNTGLEIDGSNKGHYALKVKVTE
jgi:hypothetical protein